MRPEPRILPLVAAAATGVQVGAAIVATRFVVDQTSPAALAMMRYAIGTLCLLPAVVLAPRIRFARRDIAPIAALGIGQFGILVALLNYGLQSVSSARAALIIATFPLFTLAIAVLLRRERLNASGATGILLTIAGVGFALGERVLVSSGNEGEISGMLAIIGGTAVGALCAVLYRPYLEKYPVVPVSAFAMFASVLFLAVLSAGEGFFDSAPVIDLPGWSAVVFIGVSSGIGYVLWLWALRHAEPSRVTIFLSLSPVTAAVLGYLILSEPVSNTFLLGLGCVLSGLVIAHSRR